jgi:hypothetical protein
MTGLFAGLVQRGAGIASPSGVPLLSLRPRSRFEPMLGLPDVDGGESAEAAFAITPSPGTASHIDSAPLNSLTAPAAPAVIEQTLLSASNALTPPSESVADQQQPVVASAALMPSDTVLERSPAPTSGPVASPVVNSPEPIPGVSSKPEPLASEQFGVAELDETKAEPRGVDRERAAPVRVADVIAPPVPVPMMSPEYEAFSAAAEPEHEATPPQVTIAIERIDIALAPPPAPPALPRPAIPRTTGFAAYARARRGMPR